MNQIHVANLSRRENEVVQVLRENPGAKYQEMKDSLGGITEGTLKCHLTKIFQKTGCRNRTQLVTAQIVNGAMKMVMVTPTLTTKEIEVLKRLTSGESVKEIATAMEMSIKTVEAHRYNLMGKLDIHKTVLLVHYAIRTKLIELI
jgi:DNA-binding NarL/FixJ family response regulator